MRWFYIVNIVYFLSLSAAVYAERVILPPGQLAQSQTTPTESWFTQIKPYCNPVEVAMAMQRDPPPSDEQGQALAAACYALAGKIDNARDKINGLPGDRREWAAGIVFEIAHPIADEGDDASAGPIMQMVVEYSPRHFMALYHAGMALYGTGNRGKAEEDLVRFLDIYKTNDSWTENAKQTLEKIRSHS